MDEKFFEKLLESYSVDDFVSNLGALLDDPEDLTGWEFIQDIHSIAVDYSGGRNG